MTVIIVSQAPAEAPVPWWWYPGAQLFAEEPAPPRLSAADFLEEHGCPEEAALLRDAVAAVLREREGCARAAETADVPHGDQYGGYLATSPDGPWIAAAIRARPAPGQTR